MIYHGPAYLNLALRFYFLGANKATQKSQITSVDVVLTTYSVVESAFRKQTSGFKRKGETIKEKSLLHSIEWGRVVLDEAHSIKDRTSSTARAVFALHSKIRWSLSGNNFYAFFELIRCRHPSSKSSR